ncbi:MAG: cobalamin-binding protein [Gemmatimonadota bacterium]
MRIVSLACSNTEIVHALGCGHLLVGVDSHSDHPAELLERLPRVGPDLEIDLDRVAELEPDLVLASLTVPGHETVVEGLEARGIPHLTLAPLSLEDVYRNVEEVAGRLGVPERGRRLAEEMRAELGADTLTSALDDTDPQRVSVLVQWWPRPVIAPAGKSWVDPLIRRAGGRNPLSSFQQPSRRLEDAEVVELDPDVIVLSWCGVDPAKYRPDVVLGNPAFREVSAIRTGRVHCIPEAFLGRPGPRLVEGLRALRGVLDRDAHPEPGDPRC